MLIDVPSRTPTVVAAVPVVAVSENMPKAPPDDPVVPSPIICYGSVIPDPGFW